MAESNELKQILEEIPEYLGIDFVPKLFSEMQQSPEMLCHTWPLLKQTMFKGSLHRVTKELIFVVVADIKKCTYCHVAHRALAQSLGYSTALFNNIGTDLRYVEPPELRHTLEFAQILVSPGCNDTSEKMRQLEADGYNQQEINEIIGATSLAAMFTTLANGMALTDQPDNAFVKMLKP